jgi:hypothetical protein
MRIIFVLLVVLSFFALCRGPLASAGRSNKAASTTVDIHRTLFLNGGQKTVDLSTYCLPFPSDPPLAGSVQHAASNHSVG